MQPFDREYEQRLMDLMMLAIERPSREWRELLEASCDEAALIEDVLSTLHEKDHLGDFLEQPVLLKLGELDLADLVGSGVAVARKACDSPSRPVDSRLPQP